MIVLGPFSAAPRAFEACLAIPAKPHRGVLPLNALHWDTLRIHFGDMVALNDRTRKKGLLTSQA